jgi:hypothetical protein
MCVYSEDYGICELLAVMHLYIMHSIRIDQILLLSLRTTSTTTTNTTLPTPNYQHAHVATYVVQPRARPPGEKVLLI